MATSTFDKKIVLSKKAADNLVRAMEEGRPSKRPDVQQKLKESDKIWNEILKRYEK